MKTDTGCCAASRYNIFGSCLLCCICILAMPLYHLHSNTANSSNKQTSELESFNDQLGVFTAGAQPMSALSEAVRTEMLLECALVLARNVPNPDILVKEITKKVEDAQNQTDEKYEAMAEMTFDAEIGLFDWPYYRNMRQQLYADISAHAVMRIWVELLSLIGHDLQSRIEVAVRLQNAAIQRYVAMHTTLTWMAQMSVIKLEMVVNNTMENQMIVAGYERALRQASDLYDIQMPEDNMSQSTDAEDPHDVFKRTLHSAMTQLKQMRRSQRTLHANIVTQLDKLIATNKHNQAQTSSVFMSTVFICCILCLSLSILAQMFVNRLKRARRNLDQLEHGWHTRTSGQRDSLSPKATEIPPPPLTSNVPTSSIPLIQTCASSPPTAENASRSRTIRSHSMESRNSLPTTHGLSVSRNELHKAHSTESRTTINNNNNIGNNNSVGHYKRRISNASSQRADKLWHKITKDQSMRRMSMLTFV